MVRSDDGGGGRRRAQWLNSGMWKDGEDAGGICFAGFLRVPLLFVVSKALGLKLRAQAKIHKYASEHTQAHTLSCTDKQMSTQLSSTGTPSVTSGPR